MSDLPNRFLLSLRAVMDANGWRQNYVARACKLPVSYVSRILNGKVNLTFETIEKIESGLGYRFIEIKTGLVIPKNDGCNYDYITWNYGGVVIC